MQKGDLKIELPVKLEELLNYTFNFDNLIKAIAFLHNNDMSLYSNLNDFDKRISNLEELKNEIEEIKIQSKNIQNTNDNINRTIQNMQERFLKIDFKLNELNIKTSENKSNLEEQTKNIELHSKNIDHLNKVMEDNIKKTNHIWDDLEQNKKEILIINEKILELKQKDKDLEDLVQMKNQLLNARIDENKKDITKINNYVDELKFFYNNLKKDIEIKNREFENSISNIVNNIASGNIEYFPK